VNQVNIRGDREFAPGYHIFAGRIDLFGDDGSILFTTDVEMTGEFRDGDFVLPTPQADVRTVRFTSTDDESIEPGLAEFQVLGTFQEESDSPDPTLSIRVDGDNVVIEWTGGILETAASVDGPYQDAGAPSPFVLAPADLLGMQFARVRGE
jgi:hypothetical protein